ncbi:unnamed protein product, partial [Polarella glacialis]
EPGPRSIVVRPPIALRAGDCLGWSVCGPVPFPFDDCQESGEEALMGVSEEMPQMPLGPTTASSFRLEVQRAPCRLYS